VQQARTLDWLLSNSTTDYRALWESYNNHMVALEQVGGADLSCGARVRPTHSMHMRCALVLLVLHLFRLTARCWLGCSSSASRLRMCTFPAPSASRMSPQRATN
jgi:hypothetical protein